MAMNEQKEMTITSPSPQLRYWETPPEFIRIRVADIEPFVPKANALAPFPEGLSIELTAAQVFVKNVPRLPLRVLSELLPGYFSPSEGMVKLPAAKLAAAYRMVRHEEKLPDPEPKSVPEPKTEPLAESAPQPDRTDRTYRTDKPESQQIPAAALQRAASEPAASVSPQPADSSPAPALPLQIPMAARASSIPPPPTGSPKAPPFPVARPVTEESQVASGKFPPKRTGSFVGLPLLRRKTAVAAVEPPAETVPSEPTPPVEEALATPPPPSAELPAESSSALPPAESFSDSSNIKKIELPASIESSTPAAAIEESAPEKSLPAISEPEPVKAEPIAAVEPVAVEPEPIAAPLPKEPQTMTVLETEPYTGESQHQEIVEQEPLQALFLTEETLTVDGIIQHCCGLPGINSCVLAHESTIVASHNVPHGVDLISMSANAADMLRAMRESSARMGVGTVPAVTLHTEKGVISFFNRDELTMLVFHKDRGFVPGVREKMAAVLGELTKARLTLPMGGEDA